MSDPQDDTDFTPAPAFPTVGTVPDVDTQLAQMDDRLTVLEGKVAELADQAPAEVITRE